MESLQIFKNETFGEVRTVIRDGEPWFVATDVCKALEIDSTASRRLDDDEKSALRLTQTSSNGVEQEREVTIINEAGLYSLVLGSRKPEAKAFKRWITHEVIPTIRKHGAYMTEQTIAKALESPDFLIELATKLKTEQEERKRLEAENAEQAKELDEAKPKVIFADGVCASKTSILIGDLAKLIRQNGVEVGQKRLFAWLRENGYLMKSGESYNMPTQRSMEAKWFEIKESSVLNPDGSIRVTKTPKVTGKGQVYFVNMFLAGNKA